MKVFLMLVLFLFLFSCKDTPPNSSVSKVTIADWKDESGHSHSQEYTIIIIDSCEYLLSDRGSRNITHKGNCKFCELRKCK